MTVDQLIKDPRQIEFAAREYKRHIKRTRKLGPNSVNASLTAIDHFFQHLGATSTKVAREDLPQESPKALSPTEQKRFISAANAQHRALDRAVANLLIYTGIRVGECAALDLVDVSVAGRKNQITVRNGKGDRHREIPLNEDARSALREWILERNKRFSHQAVNDALFLNPQGHRMSTTSLDRIVRKIGEACGLVLSAHVLRHTCLTNLVRKGNDLVLVAEIGGHKRLETTRRYALPTSLDKQNALNSLLT
jgi:integrase/recombinase XerC